MAENVSKEIIEGVDTVRRMLRAIGGDRSHKQRIMDSDLATIRASLTGGGDPSWNDVDDATLAVLIHRAQQILKIIPSQVVSVEHWLLTLID